MTEPASSPSERALGRAEWQEKLFAPKLRRLELSKLVAEWPTESIRVAVHRNTPFELIATALEPFAVFEGWRPSWHVGAYDDTFAFADVVATDAHIVWVDTSRYTSMPAAELEAWLRERLGALRSKDSSPILAVLIDDRGPEWTRPVEEIAGHLPGVRVASVQPLARQIGDGFLDLRREELTGTPLSDRAQLELARQLGARWLPAMLKPAIKAIAVDCDHTLYAGIVGEDGISGIEISPDHRRLHAALRAHREAGLFLAVLSRNEHRDVAALFRERKDLGIEWDDFSAHAISWAPKAEGLQAVAAALRIGVDSIVLLDDNPGELAAVAASLPTARTLWAGPTPLLAAMAVEQLPGAWRFSSDDTDSLRVADLEASRERALQAVDVDPVSYRHSLAIRVHVAMDPRQDLARLHSLSERTNQFNLALCRLSETELDARMQDPAGGVVAVRLADRLSDSGIIALVAGRRDESGVVRIDEVCMSCRALGRELESIIVWSAIGRLLDKVGDVAVELYHRRGPRNGPALAWLEQVTGETPDEAGFARVAHVPEIDVAGIELTVE